MRLQVGAGSVTGPHDAPLVVPAQDGWDLCSALTHAFAVGTARALDGVRRSPAAASWGSSAADRAGREKVVRVWRLYLVGGSMAFRDGRMGVDQLLAVRPGAAHSLPAQRGWRVT